MRTFLQDPLGGLWRFWASRKLTAALLIVVAIFGLLALAFAQMPSGIQSDPSAYGRWLADMRNRYGDYQELLQRLGLLSIGDSLGLRLLLGALALNAAVHVAELVSTMVGLSRGAQAAGVAVLEIPDDEDGKLQAACAEWAEGRGMHDTEGQEGAILQMRRFPVRGVALLLPYAAILLLLAGLAANDHFGWRQNDLILSPGHEVTVDHASGLVLRGSAANEPTADIAFTVLRDGEPVREGRLSAGLPSRSGAYLIRRTSQGPSIVVQAENLGGQAVAVRSQPPRPADGMGTELIFRDTGDEGYLLISDITASFRLTYYAEIPQSQLDGPVIHVQAIRSGETLPSWETWVEGDGSWSYQGITFHLTQRSYALVSVAFAPGLALMGIGVLALLGGGALMLLSSPIYGLGLERGDGKCRISLQYMPPLLGALDRRRVAAVKDELQAPGSSQPCAE